MTAVALRKRVRRLEQVRQGHERVRVVTWWPEEPKPAVEADELLILVTRFAKRPVEQAAGA